MNFPKALSHHAKAGHALKNGDRQAAMHHLGHMMAALKHGSPKVQSDQAIAEPITPPQPSPTPQAPPSLRTRLAGLKKAPALATLPPD